MNYNYPQPQYQNQQPQNYSGYRGAPQYTPWNQAQSNIAQVRPVTSIEEVRACPIDFDGSVFYFIDAANHKIYTKQINADGTVNISLYEQKELVPADQTIDSRYVTKQEFDNAIAELKRLYENTTIIEDVQQSAAQPIKQYQF